jgi:hypothetical protein
MQYLRILERVSEFYSCCKCSSVYVCARLFVVGSSFKVFPPPFCCTALPFLGNTQVFLWYPTVAVAATWALTIVLTLLGLRFNMTRTVMAFHFG